MTYFLFISIAGTLTLTGAVFFSFYSRWQVGRVLVPLLSLLLMAAGYAEYLASFDTDLVLKTLWLRCAVVLHFFIGISLLELTVLFLGRYTFGSPVTIRSRKLRLWVVWRAGFLFGVAAAIFLPWFEFAVSDSEIVVVLNRFGEMIFAVLFCYYLLTLYIVEKIFRNSTIVQKRIFMLYLASTALIALGSMVVLVRILFYRIYSFDILQIHAALCAVFFPGILIGLIRYRLWKEQVVIGRGMVYTSITILFFGLFLIFMGVLALAVRVLGIEFDKFEVFVIVFLVLFLGVFTIFSPQMRKGITAFSRKYIYKSKYDYRDQLLRLHNAHQTSGDVRKTIGAFIDNLRYTIIVDNAFIFLRPSNEHCFVCTDDEPGRPGRTVTLNGNSPLVRLFEENTVSAVSVDHPNADTVQKAIEFERPLIDDLSISHFFAISYQDLLVGILGINTGKRAFDSEDLMLITMFCESIGTALYRDRIQQERMEQKQFESFSHMASFIVHDIKNQVATLTLVTKNAKANIGNPDFHPVLLRSLENCSHNLESLIQKLQSPPHKEELKSDECNSSDIVSNVIEQLRHALPEGISITADLPEVPAVSADPTALYYVLKNLLINAVEALGKKGEITCSTGTISSSGEAEACTPELTPDERSRFRIFIAVEDNGPGMSRSFVEERLFKPFHSTKDKGIGIGLYQCRTLVESMGGRIFCSSEEGKGTRFCILL